MKRIPLLLALLMTMGLTSSLFGQRLNGKASYYADRFHGRPTSTGEMYNKDAFTAASKEFPVGTVLRVRNVANNQVTQVRINDCGPHHPNRIIDLSRAAAAQIDLLRAGTAMVQLEVVAMGTDGLACDRSKQVKAGTLASASTTTAATTTTTATAAPTRPANYGSATIGSVGSGPVTPAVPAPNVTMEDDASLPTGTDVVFPLYGVQVAAYGSAANAKVYMESPESKGMGFLFIRTDSKLSRVFVGPFLDRNDAEAKLAELKKTKKIQGIVRQVQ